MKRRGERILGPYPDRRGWRVVSVDAVGERESVVFESEAKALRYVEILTAELQSEDRTTATALDEYEKYLSDKGNKVESTKVTRWAVELFFPSPVSLRQLTAKRCALRYEELRTQSSARTGKPLAADTHRNVLAQTKSFLAWCVERGWLRENPCEGIKGIGKRRPRGKSLGKDGNTLRVREARAWYVRAVARANAGDHGATAALVALLLGMRASEITSRRVADLDEDAAPGDLLWIPCAKTPAGRRTVEVPEVLRPMLVACVEGKRGDRYIFECERRHERGRGKPHERGWVIAQVQRICDLAKVPKVTAHAMRGLLATITAERGLAGHLIAATLGHEDERTTFGAYAAPGAEAAGAHQRGLTLLQGGKP